MASRGEYSRKSMEIRLSGKNVEETRLEMRKQYLQKLEIRVPEPAGSGEMYEELKQMGKNMKLIYDQVQCLINESEKMLEEMYKPFENADGLLSKSFQGGT